MIHPTAIISPSAIVADNVAIGAYTIVGDGVSIGDGTRIGPHVVIDPHVAIGPRCRIFQYATLGVRPGDSKTNGDRNQVVIGSDVTIREFAIVQRGTGTGGGITAIGDQSYLMAYTHIAHDCKVGIKVVLANNATLAGQSTIGDHVTLGGLVEIHQSVRVGDYTFVGGKTSAEKDIPPYVIAAGDPIMLRGLNHVGLKRHNFSEPALAALKKAYRILFRYGLPQNEAIERIRAEVERLPEVEHFVDFISSARHGVTQ